MTDIVGRLRACDKEVQNWAEWPDYGDLQCIRAAADEIERLRKHLKWFCDRVDAGEVHSKVTYQRFKDELSK